MGGLGDLKAKDRVPTWASDLTGGCLNVQLSRTPPLLSLSLSLHTNGALLLLNSSAFPFFFLLNKWSWSIQQLVPLCIFGLTSPPPIPCNLSLYIHSLHALKPHPHALQRQNPIPAFTPMFIRTLVAPSRGMRQVSNVYLLFFLSDGRNHRIRIYPN